MNVQRVIPILRMFDVEATQRFYVDYLGCTLDSQDGEFGEPVFMHVSRGDLHLNLSSHHGDGTPGAVVLIRSASSSPARAGPARPARRRSGPGG